MIGYSSRGQGNKLRCHTNKKVVHHISQSLKLDSFRSGSDATISVVYLDLSIP